MISCHPLSCPTRRAGFVLLEVLISLAILGFAVAALMRSFTQSLGAAHRMEVQTQAQFFAQQLLHEFEIFPPDEGRSEGGFGDDYRNYSYRVQVRYAEPNYSRREGADGIDQYFAMKEISLEIVYDSGKDAAFVPVRLDSALISFQKIVELR